MLVCSCLRGCLSLADALSSPCISSTSSMLALFFPWLTDSFSTRLLGAPHLRSLHVSQQQHLQSYRHTSPTLSLTRFHQCTMALSMSGGSMRVLICPKVGLLRSLGVGQLMRNFSDRGGSDRGGRGGGGSRGLLTPPSPPLCLCVC
jgi:hypothetical protein